MMQSSEGRNNLEELLSKAMLLKDLLPTPHRVLGKLSFPKEAM